MVPKSTCLVCVPLSLPLPLSLPPQPIYLHAHSMQQHSIGEILEYATLWSVLRKDIPSFERHISQVKTYYDSAYDQTLLSSPSYPPTPPTAITT
jgi:hypothetical protein